MGAFFPFVFSLLSQNMFGNNVGLMFQALSCQKTHSKTVTCRQKQVSNKKYLFQSVKDYQESKSTYPYRERLIRNQKVLVFYQKRLNRNQKVFVLIGKSLLRIKKYLSLSGKAD